MNRFLQKKKLRTETGPDEVAKPESQPLQSIPVPHNWTWGKKKPPTQHKPDAIRPTPVLPLADNFRTSLIMPNLSARFSMLREQDDPDSPLGKAKDDSVLSPKRRSRLIDFGHVAGNLTDIVETSATAGPVPAPFAAVRKTSFTYGQAPDLDDIFSTESSMMNRPRVGESNNLFGGRQKIYRVPSVSGGEGRPSDVSDRPSPRKIRSRPMADNGVGQSPFQKFREDEKKREIQKASTALSAACSEKEKTMTNGEAESQPSFVHDPKRDTSSSSTSGPSMRSVSTAATAYSPQLPSEPSPRLSQSHIFQTSKPNLERSSSKRLYEQGLTQHMHDQQALAIARANSTKLKGSLPASMLNSQNVSKLRERLERSDSAAAKIALPPLELDKLTTFESLRAPKPSATTLEKVSTQRAALSPFDESIEATNVLYEAINPSDRGKATAMAHFQKPKKFDEAQYLQRQMSLLQQQSRRKRRSVLSPVKKATFPGKSGSPMKTPRPRVLVESVVRKGSSTSKSAETADADADVSTAFEDVAESDETFDDLQTSDDVQTGQLQSDSDNSADQSGGNSVNISTPKLNTAASGQAFEVATPVKRSSSSGFHDSHTPSPRSPEATKERRKGWSPERLRSGLGADSPLFKPQSFDEPMAIPDSNSYLSPETVPGANLKGLVRTHLRQISNVSTVSASPNYEKTMSVFRNMPSMYGPMSSSNFLATSPKERPTFPSLKELSSEDSPIRVEHSRQHTRGGSTESQHERLAFAKELAERQRAIQENLKIRVEHDNKSPASVPASVANSRSVFEHPFKPFGVLRAMSSRDSIAQKLEVPVKPYKWVDMSAEEFGVSGQAKDAVDIRVRSISPTGVGRTLHSRMREPKNIRPSDVTRARKQRQVGTRNERSTPRKEGNRFSRILADSARNSIVAMTSSGRSSAMPSEESEVFSSADVSRRTLTQNDYDPASTSDNHVRPSLQLRTSSEAPPRDSTSTPLRASSSDVKPDPKVEEDQAANEDYNPLKVEPNTPSTTTPSTVSTSTFSTPLLASSNASFSTPKTSASTASTTSPGYHDLPATSTTPEPYLLMKPTIHLRTPLVELFSQSHNLLGRSKATSNSNTTADNRAPLIKKSDISEPTLIASTSTVDTVPLPFGASLKNGMGFAGDVDTVLAARAAGGSQSGLASRADAPLHLMRKPWESKENDRRAGEKENTNIKERKGFLARMGRAASSEKRENRQ